jgi:hypothetical protein
MAKKKMKELQYKSHHILPDLFNRQPSFRLAKKSAKGVKQSLVDVAADFSVDFEFLPPGSAAGQDTQKPSTNVSFNVVCSLNTDFVAMFAYYTSFDATGMSSVTPTGHIDTATAVVATSNFRWQSNFTTPADEGDYLYTIVAFYSPPGGTPVVQSISAWFTVKA